MKTKSGLKGITWRMGKCSTIVLSPLWHLLSRKSPIPTILPPVRPCRPQLFDSHLQSTNLPKTANPYTSNQLTCPLCLPPPTAPNPAQQRVPLLVRASTLLLRLLLPPQKITLRDSMDLEGQTDVRRDVQVLTQRLVDDPRAFCFRPLVRV